MDFLILSPMVCSVVSDSQWELVVNSVLQANQQKVTAALHFPPVSYIIQNFSKLIALLATSFTLISYLAYSLALKIDAPSSS
jgi:hypothetical protein